MGYQCYICDGGAAFQIGPNLQTAPTVVNVNVPFTPEDNHIYLPPRLYLSVNAFVVTENKERVTFLQMTTGRAHDIETKDIYQIIRLFPMDERGSINWSFLFIAPDQCAEGIAKTQAASLKRFEVEGVKVDVEIGWMVAKDESKNVFLVNFIVPS